MTAPVTFWTNTNFSGTASPVQYGSYPSLTPTGIAPNTASSLKVGPLTDVYLYSLVNFDGTMVKISSGDIPNLGSPYNFNDKLRSLKVVFAEPPMATQVACCRGTNNAPCGPYLPGTGRCDQVMLNYCPSVMDAGCRDWASKNPGTADDMVTTWCKTHPSDPFCSCILSPVQTKMIVNPKCIDAQCLLGGYQTLGMKQTACPSVVTCNMQIDARNSGTQLATSIPVEQNCGANSTTSMNTKSTDTTNNYTGAAANQPSMSTGVILFLVFLFMLLIAVVTYVVGARKAVAATASSPKVAVKN